MGEVDNITEKLLKREEKPALETGEIRFFKGSEKGWNRTF